MHREEIRKIIKEEGIKFIQLWFTDLEGSLKSVSIPASRWDDVLTWGASFDGSSIRGFARIEESDMFLYPDLSTFVILPVESSVGKIARVFCDVKTPDGNYYEDSPRWILRKALKDAEKEGFTYYVGPELEFFYFKSHKGTEFLDFKGYFDYIPPDTGEALLRETVEPLASMGIEVEYIHHEVSPSQYEIDLKYSDALTMADALVTAKFIVKYVAEKNGYYATFMPKPVEGINGSGLHLHQSLFRGKENTFFDESDPYHLSEMGRGFLAGLLRHSREITLVTNQWINSYKRLVPGYEAPVYICWGRYNRSPLVRIPAIPLEKKSSMRVEYRSPDPACNPYLVFAVLLTAGLEGIKKKYDLPSAMEENVYHFTSEERKEKGIESLPGSLIEAIMEAEKGTIARKVLGDSAFEKLIASKKAQWDEYRTKVTKYEIEKYFPVL